MELPWFVMFCGGSHFVRAISFCIPMTISNLIFHGMGCIRIYFDLSHVSIFCQMKSAVTYVQILMYYSTFVWTNLYSSTFLLSIRPLYPYPSSYSRFTPVPKARGREARRVPGLSEISESC